MFHQSYFKSQNSTLFAACWWWALFCFLFLLIGTTGTAQDLLYFFAPCSANFWVCGGGPWASLQELGERASMSSPNLLSPGITGQNLQWEVGCLTAPFNQLLWRATVNGAPYPPSGLVTQCLFSLHESLVGRRGASLWHLKFHASQALKCTNRPIQLLHFLEFLLKK